jgi:hypothetical protein
MAIEEKNLFRASIETFTTSLSTRFRQVARAQWQRQQRYNGAAQGSSTFAGTSPSYAGGLWFPGRFSHGVYP